MIKVEKVFCAECETFVDTDNGHYVVPINVHICADCLHIDVELDDDIEQTVEFNENDLPF